MEALGPAATCVDCGKDLKRSAKRCSPCGDREYRRRPEVAKRNRERVAAYAKAHPKERLQWVHNYRSKVGQYTPDLTDLRNAIKNLEQALAHAEQREGMGGSAELDRHRSAERDDRSRRSKAS